MLVKQGAEVGQRETGPVRFGRTVVNNVIEI